MAIWCIEMAREKRWRAGCQISELEAAEVLGTHSLSASKNRPGENSQERRVLQC
ncbi:hypothetical protein DL98DRAFT_592567 [Cadophora sp. DSE1049]|nr:hypothetical protein DL98DRAFT_592567 [Cadophora sp. DSE1049]